MKSHEYLEIILTSKQKLNYWTKKLGYEPELNKPIKVHWSLLQTTKFRGKKVKIKCDDCGKIHDKTIKQIKIDGPNYCLNCMNLGSRNGMYGKGLNENCRIVRDKIIKEKGNPFTWESSRQKISKSMLGNTRSLNKKRSEETKLKLSNSIKKAYKEGRLKPVKKWGKTKIKKYKNMEYQSTYELNFLFFCEKLGIFDRIERGPSIEYKDSKNDPHLYFSDYKIKDTNIVVEIKSNYTWNKNLEINLQKMEYAKILYNFIVIKDNNFEEFVGLLKNYDKNLIRS